MTKTRYHNEKIYIPRDIRERLRLVDGDIVKFEIGENGEVQLVIIRASEANKRILRRLSNPPDLGCIIGHLRRIDIYEDNA